MSDAASPNKRPAEDKAEPQAVKKVKADEEGNKAGDESVDADETFGEEDMVEIDQSNIITTGRRTRGKTYDYKKLNEEMGPEEEDEDEGQDAAPDQSGVEGSEDEEEADEEGDKSTAAKETSSPKKGESSK